MWSAKCLVKDFLATLNKEPLQPHLFFEKTSDSVKYRFLIEDQEKLWSIHTKNEVAPITNHPAWVYFDGTISRLMHVNGNMVKPFRTKPEVIIPNQSVKTYFEKFIMKVASKVEIDATGFDLINKSELTGCVLVLDINMVFNQEPGIKLVMVYENVRFTSNDQQHTRMSLNFSEEEHVQILRVTRDPKAEKKYIDKLKVWGLKNTKGDAYFRLPESK